ncbi:hypothetical protein [Amycolatopsis taiwanensis]|uniref:Uncharacterized protein n=1 Tax=Amycolatopsis taiwanensis TaxID=342230 RepID=A0A9W6R0K3_9PSEU|nr:hypothetical protein [Amycolatopsis taiwanensis]GLY65382.1 hypothetical protein Atai01_20010 [Amycolatopsis taiwanensis]
MPYPTPIGMNRAVVAVDLSFEPLARAITAVAGTTQALFEPATLRRLITYAEPILPVVAGALGCGPMGQVTTQVALRLVRKALPESAESGTCAVSNIPVTRE